MAARLEEETLGPSPTSLKDELCIPTPDIPGPLQLGSAVETLDPYLTLFSLACITSLPGHHPEKAFPNSPLISVY